MRTFALKFNHQITFMNANLPPIEKILFNEEVIQKRIKELADEIATDYDDILAIIVLKGAMFFAADLLKNMTVPVEIDTIHLGSYGMRGAKSEAVRLNNDIIISIEGRHVLIIEDIVDTGKTMKYLHELFELRNPASVKLCSFLSKPSRREIEIDIDYLGFEIPDEFVVGYGFDYKEKYRTLRDIVVMKLE